jgi:glutamate-ammonia-ligase adenylyltransferase
MRIIDSRLYDEFLAYLEDKNFDIEEKELLASLASVSPFTFRTLQKLDLREICDSYKLFDEKEICIDIKRIMILSEEDFIKGLKNIKYKELLKIIARDVLLQQDVSKTLEELSVLADLIIQAVHQYTSNIFLKKLQKPITIIAMGKLGSRELNFSSDIDIVYVHGSQDIEEQEIYSKWALKLNKMLSHYNKDGFLFRVDNEIRPGGKYSPLTMSSNAFIDFYALYGETWQRVALLRARFICGDESVFKSIFEDLEPYIYRRYVDFTMVNELRELKQKINRESLAYDWESRNIKLGRGGIREIEFFVQSLQIMFGGKNKKIRVPNITSAIMVLSEEKYITTEEREKLLDAYKFLRKVENSIQMEEEQQVYTLPTDKIKLMRTAKRIGFDNVNAFLKELDKHRNFVSEIFDKLFGEKEDAVSFINIDSVEELKKNLEKSLNLNKFPEENIKEMVSYIEKIPSKYRGLYSAVLKTFLNKLENLDFSKDTLNRIEDFLNVLSKRPMYISLLSENPIIVEKLVKLFNAGPFLGKILISSPETLDFLLVDDEIKRDSWVNYYNLLYSMIEKTDDFEVQMKLMRQFKNSEWLKIGMLFSNNTIGLYELEHYLTNLAEASLIVMVNLCEKILKERIHQPCQKKLIIGMGKLGSREINYFSDLDLIFVYASDDENAGYYNTKLLQKVISSLTLVTEEGALYEVDMRLRPTGSQGPLVTSYRNFQEYHLKSSWIFEKQALTRARVLGEETDFSNEVKAFIDKVLYDVSYNEGILKEEIIKMRQKIENELAYKEYEKDVLEIKTGNGGIVDIEFLIQYLKLRYGSKYKELRVLNPHEFFNNLKALNILDVKIIDILMANYELLKKVDMAIRLIYGYSKHSIKIGGEHIKNIMSFLGYREVSEKSFIENLKRIKKENRKIFLRILNG